MPSGLWVQLPPRTLNTSLWWNWHTRMFQKHAALFGLAGSSPAEDIFWKRGEYCFVATVWKTVHF